MVNRKGGLSGKQKSALLKKKRHEQADLARKSRTHDQQQQHPHAQDALHQNASADTNNAAQRALTQQVSRQGGVNALSTAFVRDDDEDVRLRRIDAQRPLDAHARGQPIVAARPLGGRSLGLPVRPEWHGSVGRGDVTSLERSEQADFDAWLDSIYSRFDALELSPFEHNLEVWRQLWRVLERSDVICLVADARNPLLHIPAALYAHCIERELPLVVVLSKVDLVSEEHVQSWEAYLARAFPALRVARFSAKGRAVGASVEGGGAAARRKSLALVPTSLEKEQARRYVHQIAEVCGVELGSASDNAGFVDAGADDDSASAPEEDEGGDASEEVEGSAKAAEPSLDATREAPPSGESSSTSIGESSEQSEDSDDEDSMLMRLAHAHGSKQPRAAKELEADEASDVEPSERALEPAPSAAVGSKCADKELAPVAPGCRTIGFVGHPNAGKTSLLNAFVGRKVASVSSTPGHTKHLQTWLISPQVELCDCPGLVFPVAGACLQGTSTRPRVLFELCGLFPVAQVREAYSAVRFLGERLDLVGMYNLNARDLEEAAEEEGKLSPLGFCVALAAKRGYRLSRGRGAPDPHRAGLEVLKDCVDGILCLAFEPPAEDTEEAAPEVSLARGINNLPLGDACALEVVARLLPDEFFDTVEEDVDLG